MTATRTGDLLSVYPFEKLRAGLLKATKAVMAAEADRTGVDDDAFAKLLENQDKLVARLAAVGPTSAEEAIFLLRILRDRMVEDFNPDQTAAADRDIVRGVTDYLSDTMPRPHGGTALAKTDWPALLDEYRRLAQASWDASCQEDDANKDDENRPALERAATETRQRCENIETRIAELEVDGLPALAVKMAVAWTDIVPEFEFEPSDLPIKAAVVRSAIDFLSRETGLDLFVEFSRGGRGKLPRYDDPERIGGAS